MIKNYFKILAILGFSLQLQALRHGDSFYLKILGEEKYLTAGVETFEFNGKNYQLLKSQSIFTDIKEAASRWILRIFNGTNNEELLENQPVTCTLQNTFTGGQLTCNFDGFWYPGGMRPWNEAELFSFNAGGSRFNINGFALNYPLFNARINGSTLTLNLAAFTPPHHRTIKETPIIYRTDLNPNTIRISPEFKPATVFEIIGIDNGSPTLEENQKKITQALQARGFKKLNGSGSRVFVFLDNKNNRQIFTLHCSMPEEGFSGSLYKYFEDSDTIKYVCQSSPFLRKSGDSWFPKEHTFSDLDMKNDLIIASSGMVIGGSTGFRFPPPPHGPQSGLFLPVQVKLDELSFVRHARWGAWLEHKYGAGITNPNGTITENPDRRYQLMPQNNPYKFYITGNWDARTAVTFAGQVVSPPAPETYTTSFFVDPQSTLTPQEQTASKVYRDLKFGPDNILYALKAAPPIEAKMITYNGTSWQFMDTPIVPVRLATDSDRNPYILSTDGKLYVFQNNTWTAIPWNATAVLNGNPPKRFSVAGNPENLKIVVVANNGELAAGIGSATQISLSNISVANNPLFGVIDASIASDGTIVLCVKDNDTNENGQMWQGDIATAINSNFANAEADQITLPATT